MISFSTIFSETLAFLKERLGMQSLSTLAKDTSIVDAAQFVVRVYYGVLPFAAFLYVSGTTFGRAGFSPLWPVAWAEWFHLTYSEALLFIDCALLLSALVAALLYRYQFVRILVFFFLWQAHALESSFGNINHQWYPWVYTSFIFIFLPTLTTASRAAQARVYLLLVWLAQAVYAAIYTLAGIHKTLYALMQGLAGQVHSFHPYAFAYQVADWLPRLQHDAVFAHFVVNYPYVSWPFYVGLILLQLFSWLVLVRFELQRPWALCMFVFHVGTYLTMGIQFQPFMLLLLLLFLPSPFTKKRES